MRWALGLLAACTLLVPVRPAAALEQGDYERILAGAAGRRDAMLKDLLAHPFPSSGMWYYEGRALAGYFLGRSDEANRAILEEREKEFPAVAAGKETGFHWHAYLLERIYFLFGARSKRFPGRMSPQAEDALVDMLWQWASPACRREMTLPERDWWIWGSENHHAQAWSSFWGAAHVFVERPDYRERRYADGSTPAQMADAFDAYYKRFARERAAKGLLVECASSYNRYTLGGWYNIADFAEDPVLRRRMAMLLDLYWADWAIEQIDGVRGGSRHRCYPGRGSTAGSNDTEPLMWFHTGAVSKASNHPSLLCGATSFYRPPKIVVDLMLDVEGRGVYEYRSRRPGLARKRAPGEPPANYTQDPKAAFYAPGGVYDLAPEGGGLVRYTWCTPDFVMGTSMVEARPREDWTAISSQNRWDGVIFAGHPTARIFTQPLMPARGSVYNAEWSVQAKGVLILQRLRASNARGQRVWFDGALRREEKAGWVFAEAPRAFAAVRVVEGGTAWEPDGVAQHHEGKGAPAAGAWLKCLDEFSPVIIEVARKSDVKDFAAFQAGILANPLTWQGKRLDYRSGQHGVSLTLFGDYSRSPLVDGRPVDYAPPKVYDSPFLESDFGSGVVTIRKGREKLVLDFNRE